MPILATGADAREAIQRRAQGQARAQRQEPDGLPAMLRPHCDAACDVHGSRDQGQEHWGSTCAPLISLPHTANIFPSTITRIDTYLLVLIRGGCSLHTRGGASVHRAFYRERARSKAGL